MAHVIDLNNSKIDNSLHAYLPHYVNRKHVADKPVVLNTLYQPVQEELRFIFIVPSYNNAVWYEKNLHSIFSQKYSNYHVIYVDDASTDGTAELVENFVKQNKYEDKFTLIKNKQRRGMAYNRLIANRLCQPTDICMAIDGDDWFPHNDVLSLYNKIYHDRNVWMTYGQFVSYPSGREGFCKELPGDVIAQNAFRSVCWTTTHLKTYYAWLYRLVDEECFKKHGIFLRAATDYAMMYPMLEMAGIHSKFVPEITYVYNQANPLALLNQKKTKQKMSQAKSFVLSQRRYKPIRIDLKQNLSNEIMVRHCRTAPHSVVIKKIKKQQWSGLRAR